MYKEYLLGLTNIFSTLNFKQIEWKERIRKQWKESQNFPRKKKKKVRKGLLLEWKIANTEIF